jgi:hypothetical protein
MPSSWEESMLLAPAMRPLQLGVPQKQSKDWAMAHSVLG